MKYARESARVKVDPFRLLSPYGGNVRDYIRDSCGLTAEEENCSNNLYSNWGEFEPYVPEDVTNEQVFRDHDLALLADHTSEHLMDSLEEEQLSRNIIQLWLTPEEDETEDVTIEKIRGEEPMYYARCNRSLLPAEKRREQKRRAKERRIKLARPDITEVKSNTETDSNVETVIVAHGGLFWQKCEKATQLLNELEKWSREELVSYEMVLPMKLCRETIRKYYKEVKFAGHYGVYGVTGAYVCPHTINRETDLVAVDSAEEDSSAENSTKESASLYVNDTNRMQEQKKSAKSGVSSSDVKITDAHPRIANANPMPWYHFI